MTPTTIKPEFLSRKLRESLRRSCRCGVLPGRSASHRAVRVAGRAFKCPALPPPPRALGTSPQMLRSYVWRAEDWCTTAPVHDVATFLVRRDHRLARELRDMLQAEVPVRSQSELGR